MKQTNKNHDEARCNFRSNLIKSIKCVVIFTSRTDFFFFFFLLHHSFVFCLVHLYDGQNVWMLVCPSAIWILWNCVAQMRNERNKIIIKKNDDRSNDKNVNFCAVYRWLSFSWFEAPARVINLLRSRKKNCFLRFVRHQRQSKQKINRNKIRQDA